MDHSSVGVDLTYEGKDYSMKIYPPAVHSIKILTPRLKTFSSKTMGGYRGKVNSMQKVTDFLESREPDELDGFRIEVRTHASTLEQAYDND